MRKTIFMFGSDHLPHLREVGVDPMKVMLVVEGDEEEARSKVFSSPIGRAFSSSYDHERHAEEFKTEHGMEEYSLDFVTGRKVIAKLSVEVSPAAVFEDMSAYAMDMDGVIDVIYPNHIIMYTELYKLNTLAENILSLADGDGEPYEYLEYKTTILKAV